MNVKKIKKAVVIGMCCTIISTSTVFALSNNLNVNSDIKIQLNNEWIQVSLNPIIENDRTLVPLLEFMDKLGAKVESDLKTGTIKIYTDEITIELAAGKSSAKVIRNEGGSLIEETSNLEVSPKIVEEKIYVPLRYTAETLGFDVQWDNSLRAVIMKEEGDIIGVERPVEFEIIDRQSIDDNELLSDLYNKNYMTKGMYSLIDKDYVHVLLSAGERPTSGYNMEVNSITEVNPGTVYIYAELNSPADGDMVTQVLTYPSVLVKFSKDNIQNIQWDMTGDISKDEAEKNEVIKFVQGFGGQLKMVSLLAPEDILKEAMNEYYGEYVSPELIEKWLADPVADPGRLTSSPWPGRIDVSSVDKTAENEYVVRGNILEFTGVEMVDGGIASKREITLNINKIDDKLVIVEVKLGEYEEDEEIAAYKNEEYGFSFALPEGWKNYSIHNDVWKGISLTEENKETSGPIIYIRHPEWTKDSPRQDIPVMVFTTEQWKAIENEEFSIGAAPIGPSKLGENSKYVFALLARYNYEFLEGFEEVEKILESNPLETFEVK